MALNKFIKGQTLKVTQLNEMVDGIESATTSVSKKVQFYTTYDETFDYNVGDIVTKDDELYIVSKENIRYIYFPNEYPESYELIPDLNEDGAQDISDATNFTDAIRNNTYRELGLKFYYYYKLGNINVFWRIENKLTVLKPSKLSELTDDLGDSPTHTHKQYLSKTADNEVIIASGKNGQGYIGTDYDNEGYPYPCIGFEKTNIILYPYEGSTVQIYDTAADTYEKVATEDYVNTEIGKLDIPSAVTENTVSDWGFTKNEGTYSKPTSGIPKTDLDSSVQASLGKADTALQSHQDISGKQDTLVSGTNIKTINGESILGSGNISVEDAAKTTSTTTSITSISITSDVVIATISASATFGLSSVPTSGKEIHVIINNSGSSSIDVALPTSGNYVNCGDDTISIDASGYGEVNAISDGTKIYLRGV